MSIRRAFLRARVAIRTRDYRLARNLSRSEALRRAIRLDKRAGYGDFRGFTYDHRTGRATLT